MSFFIQTPDNKKVELYYRNTYTDFDKKKELLQNYVLDRYDEYISSHWLSGKTKHLLNQCANFLLLNESKEGQILSDYKQKQIHDNEKPLSSRSAALSDYFYSSIYDSRMESVKISNVAGEQNTSTDTISNDFKNSKTYKLHRLYSRKGIQTYREITTLNKNGKPIRNIFRQPVIDIKYVTINERKGLFKLNEKVVSKWCMVDTDNKFIFNDIVFKISDSRENYKVKEDNQSEMDRILCYYSYDQDKYFFFDENIDEISKYITQI